MQLSGDRGFPGSGLMAFVWLWLMLLSASAFAAQPQPAAAAGPVGEVTFVQGIATAQTPGASPRFLQKGEPLHEGEVINTGGQGYAIISFKDGTKFTLRPNTSFAIETYRQGGAGESALFRLLKGGMRSVTGLLSKKDPRAMEVRTTNATIGIRGTSFDVRICEKDCAEEQGRAPRKPAAAEADLVVARVVRLSGSAQAIAGANLTRALTEGAALFNGETVRTDKASHAVLAFRDQSKITVIADSEFRLEDVRFSGPRAESGNFATRIVRGGIRALTGLLGKSNPKAVTFGITTAVIGLRGSGFDGWIAPLCPPGGACGDAAIVDTWLDGTELSAGGQVQPMDQGQSAASVDGKLILLDKAPPFIDSNAPRPDTVPVNFDTLFAQAQDKPEPGLHVGVTEGATILQGAKGEVVIAAGEAAFLGEGSDVPRLITPNWATIMNSNLPAPDIPADRAPGILQQLKPGNVICEIR
jgi:hypothetical protein